MPKLTPQELIKALRLKLEKAETSLKEKDQKIKSLEYEVNRLKNLHFRIDDFEDSMIN